MILKLLILKLLILKILILKDFKDFDLIYYGIGETL